MQWFPHLFQTSLAAGKAPLFQRGSLVDRSPGKGLDGRRGAGDETPPTSSHTAISGCFRGPLLTPVDGTAL